jgi:hypothetical protein
MTFLAACRDRLRRSRLRVPVTHRQMMHHSFLACTQALAAASAASARHRAPGWVALGTGGPGLFGHGVLGVLGTCSDIPGCRAGLFGDVGCGLGGRVLD